MEEFYRNYNNCILTRDINLISNTIKEGRKLYHEFQDPDIMDDVRKLINIKNEITIEGINLTSLVSNKINMVKILTINRINRDKIEAKKHEILNIVKQPEFNDPLTYTNIVNNL